MNVKRRLYKIQFKIAFDPCTLVETIEDKKKVPNKRLQEDSLTFGPCIRFEFWGISCIPKTYSVVDSSSFR